MIHEGRVICSACGVIDEEATHYIESLRLDVENQTHKLRAAWREVRDLRGQQLEAIRTDPQYDVACDVLMYWRDRCSPHARKPTDERRVKLVLDLMRGHDPYSPEDLKRAIDGYAAFPYLVQGPGEWRRAEGPKHKRKVEPEFIFRTPKQVEQGLNLAARAEMFTPPPVEATHDAPESLSALGRAAATYAGKGWPVFPCIEGGKPPATSHGLLDADTNVERVKHYWSRKPYSNVAIRTGQESGLVVLDVDTKNGGDESLFELERRLGKLPDTMTVKTPSGGQHYYFQHPGHTIRNTSGVPMRGLDIRGDGGYVLAPPSVVGGRRYEIDSESAIAPMPEWLEKGLIKRERRMARDDLADIVEYGVREGERNTQLTRYAGSLIAKGAPGTLGLLKLVNKERCDPPLPERDVETIYESISRREAAKWE